MSDKRAEWLAMLAKLVTPNDPAKSLAAMLAFRPFLADLPDAAFTTASLEHTAMSPRRLHIPDLSEVKGPLAAWWREHRPRPTAIASQRSPQDEQRRPPTDEERAAVRAALAPFRTSREPERATVKPNYAPPEMLAEARAKLRGVA